MDIFPIQQDLNLSTKRKKAGYIFLFLIDLGQHINLMWTPDLKIRFWDRISGFWEFISYSSLDEIFAYLGVLNIFLIFISCSCLVVILVIGMVIVLKLFNKSGKTIILKFTKGLMFLHSELFFVCYCLLVNLLFKYSMFQYDRISEYPQYIQGNVLNFGTIGIMMGIFLQTVHLLITIIFTGFNYELRYSTFEFNSKSGVQYEILKKFIIFFSTVLYCIEEPSFYIKRLSFLICFYSACTIYYFKRIPYNLDFMNTIRLLKNLECLIISVSFLVSAIQNNSIIAVILSIFMQPIVIFFSYQGIKYRHLNLPSKILSFSDFELINRKDIKTKSDPKNFIKSCNNFYSTTNDPKFVILESYFCLDNLRNPELALIKLSLASENSANTFGKFQIMRCRKSILAEYVESNGSYICRFATKFKKVSEYDKEFCLSLLSLIEVFSSPIFNYSNAEENLAELNKLKLETINSYKELISEYPDSSGLSNNFGSFEIEFLGVKVENSANLGKFENKRDRILIKGKKFSCNDTLDAMIIIFSGSKKRFGEILYVSTSLENYLEFDSDELIKLKVFELVPDFRDINPKKSLLNYIENGLSKSFDIRRSIFLKNKYGFLVECFINFECIVEELEIKIVSIIEPCCKSRDYILIEEDGTIINHSVLAPQILQTNYHKLDKIKLSLFINIISQDASAEISESVKFNNFYYSCRKLKFINSTFSVIYLYNALMLQTIHEESETKTDLFNQYFKRESCETMKSKLENENMIKEYNEFKQGTTAFDQYSNEAKTEHKVSNRSSNSEYVTYLYKGRVRKSLSSLKYLKCSILLLVYTN